MKEKESSIKSMSVTLGSLSSSETEHKTASPWVILVCADLGYAAHHPEIVSAATFNDLFKNNQVIIRGTVSSKLPEEIAPFYIEYPVRDLKDFSRSACADTIPVCSKLSSAASLLDAISCDKISAAEGMRQLMTLDLPPTIVSQLGAVLPAPAPQPATGNRPGATKVDSILSMIDIGTSQAVPEAGSDAANFIAVVSQGAAPAFSQAAVIRCKDTIEQYRSRIAAAVMAQPFFKAAAASWNALKLLLKTAGRNRELQIVVHAAPFDAAERHFADAIKFCAQEAELPDLILWDYPVPTDNASIELLAHLGALADRYNTAVVTALYNGDPLYTSILNREPMRQVFEQPAYIPLRRCTAEQGARTLALCAPDADAPSAAADKQQTISAAWLFMVQWTLSVVESSSPLHLQNSSIALLDDYIFPKLPQDVVADAGNYGITLLRPKGITAPRALLADAQSPYSSLLFNVLVNRTARLAALWIGSQNRSLPASDAAPQLAAYLSGELIAINGINHASELKVSVDNNGSLTTDVDSSITIAGFPVRFSFSFGYNE